MWEPAGSASIRCMNVKRILVAHELACYREAIATTLREMRPGVEVFEAEAARLDREVRWLLPDMVVTSRVTELVESRIPLWVELYPNCENWSVVGVWGERYRVENMQLSDLLVLVDRMDSMACSSQAGSLVSTPPGVSSSF